MSRWLQLILELEDSEPISGSLRADGGAARPFSGWLGLMSAIKETAATDPSPLSTDGRPSAGDGGPAP